VHKLSTLVKLINKYNVQPLGLPRRAPAIVLFVIICNNSSEKEPIQINQNFNIQITTKSKPEERIFEKFYDFTNAKRPVFKKKEQQIRLQRLKKNLKWK